MITQAQADQLMDLIRTALHTRYRRTVALATGTDAEVERAIPADDAAYARLTEWVHRHTEQEGNA